MLTRQDLNVGEPVVIFSSARRYGEPAERLEGTVEKVAIKLVTIKWGDSSYQRAKFRLDDQTESRGPNASGTGMWFKTMDQAAEADRRTAALAILKSFGLVSPVGMRLKATTEQLDAMAGIVDPEFVR